MPSHHILIVVVDGLRASALGAYGNTTYATPALDKLAAESLLFDNCYAAAPELDSIYESLWRSVHPVSKQKDGGAASLADLLQGQDYETVLVSDSSAVLSFDDASKFSRRVKVAESDNAARANEIGETALGRLFAAAAEEVDRANGGKRKLLWVHSHGMYGPWDAPLELQSDLFGEDDPPPIEASEPPDLRMDESDDPDAAFRYACGYAGQVMVLDECWSALADSIDAVDGEWLVVLLGARGYSLGEHGRIGGVDGRLYAEQLHVPWLLHMPNGDGRLMRTGELVSHVDLLPTIADFVKAPVDSRWQGSSVLPLAASSRVPWRKELVAVSGAGSIAVRTPEWCWRQSTSVDDLPGHLATDSGELFVRPDDRWEANDVAKLCPEEVEVLAERALRVRQGASE